MRHFISGLVLASLLAGFAAVDAWSQDMTTKAPRKAIPAGWSKLKLTKEQTTKLYGISDGYRTKALDLQKQLDDLRAQERQELIGVLTQPQRVQLRQLTAIPDAPDAVKK